MNDLRQNFLAESISNLADLQAVLAVDFSDQQQCEAFRLIHTVKGTLQTFGLNNSAKLSNEIENLLANRAISDSENYQTLLLEGIGLLIGSLKEENSNFPTSFIEKLRTEHQKSILKSDILLTKIPLATFKNFSGIEQKVTISALRQRKNICSVEIGFKTANFADQYQNLRNILSETGEIIAVLPGFKFKEAEKIGFQIYLASKQTVEELNKKIEGLTVEIVSYNCAENSSNQLVAVFEKIAAHGESVAKQLQKQLTITVLANEIQLSIERVKTIFDILLHLVRNAADHAVETCGKIEIRLFAENEGLNLTVADDGKGVDLDKLRARAIDKNLISAGDILDERQILELIFAPEISTAESVTEISGRGIGLNAVKDSVEKSNGKISVKSSLNLGTTFEIFLPKE